MMRRGIGLLLAVAVLVVGGVPAPAWAGVHAARVFVGPRVYVGPGPYWYPYPYYAPPVVVQPSAPPVYVSPAEPVTAPAQSSSYWYHCAHHCAQPEGYYPYVSQCPGGWTRVVPQPGPAAPSSPAAP